MGARVIVGRREATSDDDSSHVYTTSPNTLTISQTSHLAVSAFEIFACHIYGCSATRGHSHELRPVKNYKTETEAAISSKWTATKSRTEYQEKAEVQSGATDRAQHQLVTAGCERFCERRKNRLLSTGLGTEMLSDF